MQGHDRSQQIGKSYFETISPLFAASSLSPFQFLQKTQADLDTLMTEKKLEIVAGNVLKVPYSGKATDDQVCYFSKCIGSPLPATIPGVNDMAECGGSA